MKREIKLERIADAIELVKRAGKIKGDVWLSNKDGYRANGKSILGVFDVAVNSAMCVEYPEDSNDFDEFLRKLELDAVPYTVDIDRM